MFIRVFFNGDNDINQRCHQFRIFVCNVRECRCRTCKIRIPITYRSNKFVKDYNRWIKICPQPDTLIRECGNFLGSFIKQRSVTCLRLVKFNKSLRPVQFDYFFRSTRSSNPHFFKCFFCRRKDIGILLIDLFRLSLAHGKIGNARSRSRKRNSPRPAEERNKAACRALQAGHGLFCHTPLQEGRCGRFSRNSKGFLRQVKLLRLLEYQRLRRIEFPQCDFFREHGFGDDARRNGKLFIAGCPPLTDFGSLHRLLCKRKFGLC